MVAKAFDKQALRRDIARDLKAKDREKLAKMRADVEAAQQALRDERTQQRALRRIERGNRRGRRPTARASVQRSQSDDEVRANIALELVSLWERVKRSIKGSDRRSRTEAFLQYVEENPNEVLGTLSDDADERVEEMIRARELEDLRFLHVGRSSVVVPRVAHCTRALRTELSEHVGQQSRRRLAPPRRRPRRLAIGHWTRLRFEWYRGLVGVLRQKAAPQHERRRLRQTIFTTSRYGANISQSSSVAMSGQVA